MYLYRFTFRNLTVFLIAMIFGAFFAGPAFTQMRRAPQPVQINKVNDHLYEMTGGGIARTAAVVGDDCFLFIDAMEDEQSMKSTIAQLEQMTGKPFKYLVLTHGDLDHIDGIRYIPTEVTVIAHKNVLDVMKFQDNGQPSDWATNPELEKYFPDELFTDRKTIDIGNRKIELYWFGAGHTPSDIFIYLPEDRIVFVGDEAGVGGVQIIHSVKGGNSFGHVQVLEKLLATIDADTYFFGHYPSGGKDIIRQRIEDMKARHVTIRKLISDGKTREEVMAEFSRREQRLAGSIFDEIKEGRDK